MITVLFAVLAFLAGLFVGHYLRDLIDLARRWCTRHTTARESRMNRPIVTSQRVQWVMLTLAVVLLLVEGLMLIHLRQENAAYVECVATTQQQKSTADRARTDAAEDVSRAVDQVIFAVANEDPDKFAAAIENYVQIRKDQDRARADHPLPAPPEQVCGKPGGV